MSMQEYPNAFHERVEQAVGFFGKEWYHEIYLEMHDCQC
jgi:hypothetical protein